MRRLMILRHAKAVAKDPVRDFDRVLAKRGRAQMTAMATLLAQEAIRPELALVSPSARTRETWGRAGLAEVEARFEPAIYDSTLATLLRLTRALPDAVGSAMLVGHNPGLEELAMRLAAAEPVEDAARIRTGLPTGGLVILGFAAASWPEIGNGAGRIERVVFPADLLPEESGGDA